MSRESIDDGSRGCCDHGIPALVACRQCAEDEARARVKLQLADIEEAGRTRGYTQAERDIVAWLENEVADVPPWMLADKMRKGDHRKEKPNGKT